MTATPDAKTALAQRRENGEIARSSIADDIRKMQEEFAAAVPADDEAGQLIRARQLVRDSLTALRTVRNLNRCEPQSILGALMTCAQLGLRIGVLGQAWPVPFWDGREKMFKAQLIIGYQGYGELAHRSPKVQSFMPRTVHEHDDFDIDYGVKGTLVHRPARGPRGKTVGYHSIARYANDGYDFLYMSKEEMDEHRDRFATTRDKAGRIFGPWIDHPDPMGMKTTQRLLSKYIPKSPELLVASYIDGGVRVNVDPLTAPEEVTEQPIAGEDLFEGEVVGGRSSDPVVDRQRKAIETLGGKLHMEQDALVGYLSEIIGRQVSSPNELTDGEAARCIDAMTSFYQQTEPSETP